MCRYGIEKFYEKLKEFICGKIINKKGFVDFVDILVIFE